jgi:hypothetical protein
MGEINIVNNPCKCAVGHCIEMMGEDDRGHCVNRLPGDVRTMPCSKCGNVTWHQDGACLRCDVVKGA